MRILSGNEANAKVNQLSSRGLKLASLEPRIKRIINNVKRRGDAAVRRYATRWDRLQENESLQVSQSDLNASWASLDSDLKRSLRTAESNIRRFCEWQMPTEWQRTRNGVCIGQIVRPIESVACYVPGGRYPLVSTVLMTVIPAQVAGVKRICIVSPGAHPTILAAARMLGIREVYRIGGAQAIAAVAYGTETVAAVDKIVGPGNAYVTAAKKLVSFDCAIDFLAGPTEIVVLSNDGDSRFIAADLVAQAEHDPDAVAVFITTQARLARDVKRDLARLSRTNKTASAALRRNGVILLAETRQQAADWANRLAPEHITVDEPDVPLIQNAGSIFIGNYSAQAAGDYASGPNHVLPTGGVARYRGGLSVLDFVKIISVQKLSRPGLRGIESVLCSLAQTEGLHAHARSIQIRCANA